MILKKLLDVVGIKNSSNVRINPSTEESLQSVITSLGSILSKLNEIDNNTDNLEVSVGDVDLNTDELEGKLDAIHAHLDVALSTRASETTLSTIKDYVDTIETKLQSLISRFDVDLSTRASENTLLQVRDYLDTVETKLQSIITTLDVALSTRASELTLNDVKTNTAALVTRTGEVQATPTQYTILGRLKDIWDKLNDLFTNGTGKIKLWNGTNQADIDSTGSILVSGKAAVGAIPATNPIAVSGIDTNGLKRHILTDGSGKIFTANPASAAVLNIPIQLGLKQTFTAVNSGEWQEVLEYIVPTGYDLSCIMFDAWSGVANERARAVFKKIIGSFNCPTNTFTDGESFTSPQFGARIYIYVTSVIGSGGNDLITITYTNQDGVAGRTGTVTIPKNSLVGTRLEITLQTGDIGIRDLTNVTHSQTGQAGAINIEASIGLFYQVLTSANVDYASPAPPIGSIVVPQGGKIYLQYRANSAVATERRLNLTATLVPR